MRDEITCCVIFALLTGLFFFNSHVVHGNTERVVCAVEALESEEVSPEDIVRLWNREKRILFYLCGHAIILEIDENIVMGCDYLESGDRQRGEHMLKKAVLLLGDLSKREKIKLDNIF